MTAQRIYDTVADDFSRVNDLIIKRLASDVPLVEKIAQYIIESGGKRLRPLLVLLASQAAGYQKDDHLKLAAVIEFLHTATLLHDDVVDTSDMRRGRSTANAKWGNAPSVLVGDFLYARAFEMMVELQSLPIMNVLSHATAVIAEGEVMQLMNVKNPDLSEDQYMVVIHNKTAMLFEAASHTGALLAGASREQENALKDYGKHLGLAFQLVDDVLDLVVGDLECRALDLKRGVVTECHLRPEGNGRGEYERLAKICTFNLEAGPINWEQSLLRDGIVVGLGYEMVDGLLADRRRPNLPFDERARGLPSAEAGDVGSCGDPLPCLLDCRVERLRGQLNREFGDAGFRTLGNDFHEDSCFHSQAETRRRG